MSKNTCKFEEVLNNHRENTWTDGSKVEKYVDMLKLAELLLGVWSSQVGNDVEGSF